LQPGVARDSPWIALNVFLAPARRFLFGFLRRIAECRVQVLSFLRHDTDPHHIDGHAAIVARTEPEERIPVEGKIAWSRLLPGVRFPVYTRSVCEVTTVKRKVILLAVAILGSGRLVLTGQQQTPPGVFTSAQAEAGRTAYENTCGKCHTYTLLGRKGEEGELPPVGSLSAAYQKFIGNPNRVPPLAGRAFLSRWGGKTVAELIARFQITASDPFFQFEGINDDTTVIITAYVLQRNGAKAGPQQLTRATGAVVNSIIQ